MHNHLKYHNLAIHHCMKTDLHIGLETIWKLSDIPQILAQNACFMHL